ncbi:MAG: hypothetical protein ACLQD8_04785 [Thermoplasmata archaeon]
MQRTPGVGDAKERRPTAILVTVGAAILLALPLASLTAAGAPSPSIRTNPDATAASLNLTIDPADWWMTGGTSAPATATWTDVAPGCVVTPLWYRWSVAPGGSEGSVAPTNRSTTNFTSVGVESGTTEITAAGAADLECGTNRTAAFRTATSTFHVDAPLVVEELRTVAPAPPSPGELEVEGTLAGGDPPFTVTVAWGDGTDTGAVVAGDGNFSVVGAPGPGPIDPVAFATDSAGLVARAAVEENSTGSRGFAISLLPSSYIADVGLPVTFHLESTAPLGNYSLITVCEDALAGSHAPAAVPGSGFSCAFAAPGIANVSVLATEDTFPFSTATARLLEPVVPRLSVGVAPSSTDAEVGRESYVALTLLGGVPPFHVRWGFVGSGRTASASLALDGRFLAALSPVLAGSEEVVVEATDALGEPAANESASIDVQSPLAGEVSATGTAAMGGTGIALSATVVAGVPPFDWTVVRTGPLADETSAGGLLAVPGPFAWSGTVRAEGPQTATLIVVDAAGAIWEGNETVAPLERLAVELRASPDGPGRWAGEVDISGGAAPFLAWVNGSDGESWNRSGLEDGRWNFSARALAEGNVSVTVTVIDRLGVTAHGSVSVNVAAGEEPPSSPPGALVGAAILLLLLGGAVTFWWWRRSKPAGSAPAVDPVEALRAIVAPADGADRAVVELLAEEQGIPLATVRSAIDRLIAEGTIRAERGPDGEEVLAWRTLP